MKLEVVVCSREIWPPALQALLLLVSAAALALTHSLVNLPQHESLYCFREGASRQYQALHRMWCITNLMNVSRFEQQK